MSIKNPTVKELLVKTDKQQQEILGAIAKIGNNTPTPPTPPDPQDPTPPSGGKKFFNAKTQLHTWLEMNKSHKDYQLLKTKIADKPCFVWLNGSEADIALVRRTMEECGDTIPAFVVYAIPDRDAQQHSAGGFKTVEDYNKWVGGLGWAVQIAGNKPCVFIVEPDALGLLNDRPTTYPCINAAVDILRKNSNTKIFVEAAMWIPANDMAGRVKGAGIERAHGIAVNTSGRAKTDVAEAYARDVLKNLRSGLQIIVDISRNGGNTKEGDWCNPTGEKLGSDPVIIDKGDVYAHGWVKLPGESDGNCNGGPNAGTLWIERAVELAS